MSATWQPATFSINLRRGRDGPPFWGEVSGFMRDVFGIHRCRGEFFRGWSVTHLPTGLACGWWDRRVDTERYVARLLRHRDWANVGPEGVRDKPTLDAIRDITYALLERQPPRRRGG